MRKFFEKYKIFALFALLSFLAVVFLCDSFKDTGHSENHAHTAGVQHHQSVSIVIPQSQSDAMDLNIPNLIGTALPSLVPVLALPILSLFSFALLLLFLIGKLRNYLYRLFSQGILNPKLY